MIDKFMHGFLNSVYGYDDYTQLEINSKLMQKMDEVIENCNSAFEFVEWLKEQGIPDEVQNILFTWKEDGTLKNLSNKKEIDNLRNEINNNINNLAYSIDKKINELKEMINQNNSNLI